MFHDKKAVSNCGDSNETTGRSCLIDDDEEREALQSTNKWAKSNTNNNQTDSELCIGKPNAQPDGDNVTKKKQKKKWVQLPLVDVGLKYQNPRQSQPEQRPKRTGISNYNFSNMFNAWKGKRGSELFVKKSVDGEFIRSASVNSNGTDETDDLSSCESQNNLSEEDLLISKALKESVKTHQKEEELRHKALLIELANLPADEKIGSDKSSSNYEYDSSNEKVTDLSKNQPLPDHNNNKNKNFNPDVRTKKLQSLKRDKIPVRSYLYPHRSTSGKDITFKTPNDEIGAEKSVDETFHLKTMTFNNSKNRNYNNKTEDIQTGVRNPKNNNGRNRKQNDENVQYTGILKNNSRVNNKTDSCPNDTDSLDFGNNETKSSFANEDTTNFRKSVKEELKEKLNVTFNLPDGKEKISSIESFNKDLAESLDVEYNTSLEVVSSGENASKSLSSSNEGIVIKDNIKERSSEVHSESIFSENFDKNKTYSSEILFASESGLCFCGDSDLDTSFNADNEDSILINKLIKLEKPKKETVPGNVSTNNAPPVSAVLSVPSPSVASAPPLVCDTNFNSVWFPAPPCVVNNGNVNANVALNVSEHVEPESNRNACKGDELRCNISFSNSSSPNNDNLNKNNANLGENQNVNVNSFRDVISELIKTKEHEIVEHVVSQIMKDSFSNQSSNNSTEVPPGFVAGSGGVQYLNSMHTFPLSSVPVNQEMRHAPSVGHPGPFIRSQPHQVPVVSKNGILNHQYYDEVKEYVQQFISQYPEVKDLTNISEGNLINNQAAADAKPEHQVPLVMAQVSKLPQPQLLRIPVPYYPEIYPSQIPSQPYVIPIPFRNSQGSQVMPPQHVPVQPQHTSEPLSPRSQPISSQPIGQMSPTQSQMQKEFFNPQLHIQTEIQNQQMPSSQYQQVGQMFLPQLAQMHRPEISQSQTVLPPGIKQPLSPTQSQNTPTSPVTQLDYLQSQINSLQYMQQQIKSQQALQQQMFPYHFVQQPHYLPMTHLQVGQMIQPTDVPENVHQHSSIGNPTDCDYRIPNNNASMCHPHQNKQMDIGNKNIVEGNYRENIPVSGNLVEKSSQDDVVMKESCLTNEEAFLDAVDGQELPLEVNNKNYGNQNVGDVRYHLDCDVQSLENKLSNSTQSSFEKLVNNRELRSGLNVQLSSSLQSQQSNANEHQAPNMMNAIPPVNNHLQSRLVNDYARFIPGQIVPAESIQGNLASDSIVLQRQQQLFQQQLMNYVKETQLNETMIRGRGRLNL